MAAPFDIALGVHDSGGYHIHSLVALHSLLSRMTEMAVVHIMHDSTLGKAEKDKFSNLASSFSANISFHALDSEIRGWPSPNSIKNFSPGCLFRLFLPTLVPDRKVLYMDSDTLMLSNPVDLFSKALTNDSAPVFVARDDFAMREDFKAHISRLGLDPAAYFNSGVILFNNPLLRKVHPDFTRQIRNIADSRRKLISFPDQDVLNLFFNGEKSPQFLPAKCNFQIGFGNRRMLAPEKMDGKLIHYTWKKPWETLFPACMAYWREREMLGQLPEVLSDSPDRGFPKSCGIAQKR